MTDQEYRVIGFVLGLVSLSLFSTISSFIDEVHRVVWRAANRRNTLILARTQERGEGGAGGHLIYIHGHQTLVRQKNIIYTLLLGMI